MYEGCSKIVCYKDLSKCDKSFFTGTCKKVLTYVYRCLYTKEVRYLYKGGNSNGNQQ